MCLSNSLIFVSITFYMIQYDQTLSEKCVQINGNSQSHHRLSRRHQQQQQEDKIITKRKTRTSSLTSDRQKRERTASCGDRRRRLQSSFSSTDSECDVSSLSNYNANKIVVPKNENLMALSLPTITLQRAFEPEELLTDSYNISKHKQLPEEEILFLPKEQPITSNFHSMKNGKESKNDNKFSRNGHQRSSYHNISKYTM